MGSGLAAEGTHAIGVVAVTRRSEVVDVGGWLVDFPTTGHFGGATWEMI